jgi:hypothetical protein
VLRKEVHGLDWKALALLATAGLYMFATPGAQQHKLREQRRQLQECCQGLSNIRVAGL